MIVNTTNDGKPREADARRRDCRRRTSVRVRRLPSKWNRNTYRATTRDRRPRRSLSRSMFGQRRGVGRRVRQQAIPRPNHWSIAEGVASACSPEVTFPDWIDEEPVEPRSEKNVWCATGPAKARVRLDRSKTNCWSCTREQPATRGQVVRGPQQRLRRAVRAVCRSATRFGSEGRRGKRTSRRCDRRCRWAPSRPRKCGKRSSNSAGKTAAHDLYQMLCGYSPEQIGTRQQFKDGLGTFSLIDWMENDSLDYRVLAVQDMWRDHRHAADAQSGGLADRACPRRPPLATAAQSG